MKPHTTKTNYSTTHVFESLSDIVDFAEAMEVQTTEDRNRAHNRDQAKQLINVCANRWTNGKDMAKIKEDLTLPPAQLLDRVNELRQQIEEIISVPQKKRRRKFRNEFEGDELDVDKFIKREVDGWSGVRKEPGEPKTVKIAINSAVNCGRRPEDLVYRGACAAALADVLEEQGVRVEIVSVTCIDGVTSRNDERKTYVECVVKAAGAPLDILSVAYATGEIGFFRVPVLGAFALLAEGKTSYGMGRPGGIEKNNANNYDIVLDVNVYTLENAIKIATDAQARFAPANQFDLIED